MDKPRAYCKECGGDAVPHRLTYITVGLDETLRPLFSPGPLMRSFMRWLYTLERYLTPALLSFLIQIGAAKIVTEPDEKTLLLAKMLWEEAPKRGIAVQEIRIFDLARNLFLATFSKGKRIAYEGIPIPPEGLAQAWWMDNKAEMKRRFRKMGFPIAAGGEALTDEGALRVFKRIESPAIVKPYSGSASRHTTLHIRSDAELVRAAHVARQVAPLALIEEELVGPVYRATVVGGKLSATLRRDPPHVMGDGTHTIAELVEDANKNPARGGPYFHKIKLDEAARQELRYQGLSSDSVPEKGRRVTLHQKVNWSVGGTTADVSDAVHPENRALFEEVANVLKAPVVGFDFIIGDLGRSYKEQKRCGFIEANSMPFFDNHHLPFEGAPQNVAGAIWAQVEPT
ncbi:MAG: hypothetical protein WBK28_03065 [Minisyncoccia bacterium]